MEQIAYGILEYSPLFIGLKKDQIEDLMGGITCQVKNYSKGEIIVHSGDPVVYQSVILSGSIKGEMIDFAGKVIKIEDIEAPRPLAPAFLFGKNNKYPVNLVANTDVMLLLIPKEEMIRLMQMSRIILSNFVDNVSNRAQFLTTKIKFLSFTTIKGKVAQYLLDLSGRVGSDVILMPHSQSQLAELFGVTRPSVGRAISEMNSAGIIRTEGKQVFLQDKVRLKDLLR